MNGDVDLIGTVVTSRAGRDKGRSFLVVSRIDENHVGLVDGELRKLVNPKKKKLKHLTLHDVAAESISEKLAQGRQIFDAEIRKYLLTAGFNREKIREEEQIV